MKKKIFVVIALIAVISVIIFVLTIFPIFIRMDDSIDLGNDYRYIQDYPQTIVLGERKEIVMPIVLRYDYDEYYIIAKTKDLETNDTLFWIVNKKSNLINNYSEFEDFNEELHNKGITLNVD